MSEEIFEKKIVINREAAKKLIEIMGSEERNMKQITFSPKFNIGDVAYECCTCQHGKINYEKVEIESIEYTIENTEEEHICYIADGVLRREEDLFTKEEIINKLNHEAERISILIEKLKYDCGF